MLKEQALKQLQNKKNLLAFSAGVDSSALFFILLEHDIAFDIAIVDYNLREQSKNEVAYAKELSQKYNLTLHHLSAKKIEKSFEAKAREIRYDFFHQLIEQHSYENLITAHHLGDRFEWMLMQFCKGAGCVELSGMKVIQKRDKYTLIRPLLHLDKQELLEYLDNHHIKYFEDESNNDTAIKRNEFRHNHTKPLLQKYLVGIKKSFEYLDEDREELVKEAKVESIKDFAYFKSMGKRSDIYTIDKYIKSLKHIITANERELLKSKTTVIVGRKFIINFAKGFVFIVPYDKTTLKLEDRFKEQCRKLKIEPKLRPYLAKNNFAFIIINNIMLELS